jgi:hypothetical protein
MRSRRFEERNHEETEMKWGGNIASPWDFAVGTLPLVFSDFDPTNRIKV